MNGFPFLTALTLTPLVGAAVVIGMPSEMRRLARGIAIAFGCLAGLLSVVIWTGFDSGSGDLQFVERGQWIPSIGVEYFVGIDGLGLLMVLLTAIVVPFSLLASRNVTANAPLHFALILLMQSGLFGTFTALNFIHWFLYWELCLIPAFFLIKLWGGPNRGPAATQFFIYTMVGSVALLLAFLAVFISVGSFDFIALAEKGRSGGIAAAMSVKLGWYGLTQHQLSLAIFGMALLGFMVKVPLMPFHTWLPAAYSEAPSSVTMLLTGLMSKMGVYGFLRIILPIFPDELRAILPQLTALTVITIVFSAFAAFAQRDLKRILAYSSINHLGYCLLGIFAVARAGGAPLNQAAALNGVLLQVFNHGLTAAALFCFISMIESRSGGWRDIGDFGGLRKIMPVFCGFMGISLFSSLGLPGLNGFVGEFLIFKGVFGLYPWAAVFSTIGLLVTAIFILTILQRVWCGPLNEKWKAMADLSNTERNIVLPAIVLMFALGIWPQALIGIFNQTVIQMVAQLKL